MTVRALGLAVLSGAAADDCPFSDVSVAQGYVALAYRMGIIKGVSAYNFEPKKEATREQAAAVLVRLGVAADAATILDLRPDVVVLAVGGHPFVEQNEHWGAAEGLVVSSWDVLDGKVAPGKNVLVYDTICEFTGMSVADFLADKGSQVEIVTDDIKPGVAIGGTSFPTYYRSMYPKEVIMTGDMMLEKVYREGDKLVAVLENEYTGAKEERVVDQVVVENGVRPDEEIYYALKEGSRNKGQIDVEALFAIKPQPCLSEAGEGYLLFRIGDCVAQRNTHAAIYDALRLCKDF